jgi:hypothetical protein
LLPTRLAGFAVIAGAVATPVPAGAQLLADRVEGERRLCVYVGSDQLPDGQVVPRNTVVPAGQPCPDIAPYRDPNRRAPGNAALLREVVENGRRQCVYGQGGVEYAVAIPQARYCAATPDLLDRLLAGPDPAAPFAIR